jgi:hypothetical protein
MSLERPHEQSDPAPTVVHPGTLEVACHPEVAGSSPVAPALTPRFFRSCEQVF